MSNLDETPTRRVEVHDFEPSLNPSIEEMTGPAVSGQKYTYVFYTLKNS